MIGEVRRRGWGWGEKGCGWKENASAKTEDERGGEAEGAAGTHRQGRAREWGRMIAKMVEREPVLSEAQTNAKRIAQHFISADLHNKKWVPAVDSKVCFSRAFFFQILFFATCLAQE